MKRSNPPAKSAMMKLFHEVPASKNGTPLPPPDGGPMTESELALDSIGCTANVILADF